MKAKNGKASVPWKQLSNDWSEFSDMEYLPEDFQFDEPAKLSKGDVLEVLEIQTG